MESFKNRRASRPAGHARVEADPVRDFARTLPVRPRRLGFNLAAIINPVQPGKRYAGAPGIQRFFGRVTAVDHQTATATLTVGEVPSGAALTVEVPLASFGPVPTTLLYPIRLITWLTADGEPDYTIEDGVSDE